MVSFWRFSRRSLEFLLILTCVGWVNSARPLVIDPVKSVDNILSIQDFPMNQLLSSTSRNKRTSEHHITDCIYMTLEEGDFYYKSSGLSEDKVCGIYISSDPDQFIEIRFNFMDLPCENNGLVVIVDGWELNGELFPNPQDHQKPLNARFSEFCGIRKSRKVFVSSQNGALIQYRVPQRDSRFSFTVKFLKNFNPCNILLQAGGVYTLRNYGKRSNCSAIVLFPAAVNVLDLNVGVVPSIGRGLQLETGTIHKVRSQCQKRGLDDYLQIGGAVGLDNSNMKIIDSVCGMDSKPERFTDLIGCETTSVKLFSSGAFQNSVTVSFRELTENDTNSHMSLICLQDEEI